MYKFGNLLEELEVLENQREKAEQAYFENEDDLETKRRLKRWQTLNPLHSDVCAM